MPGWQPLSGRRAKLTAADETLLEGVPAHLVRPLLHWFACLFEESRFLVGEVHPRGDAERKAHRIATRLQVDLRRVPVQGPALGSRVAAQALVEYASWGLTRTSGERAIERGIELRRRGLLRKERGALLLDMIDAALADGVEQEEASELERLLTDGGSAWCAADDIKSLQRRVNPTATEAFRGASDIVAADHLNAAWNAAYSRDPVPSRAYSEAIKAVEAASIPVVIPHDRIATLGKVIGELRGHPDQWQLAVSGPSGDAADVSTLVAMLRLLWEGQTDRHGTAEPPVPITAEAAEAAVHLAVTLVQWFHSGAVRRAAATTP